MFVDFLKAYDVVSHDTVLLVARRVGLSGLFLDYSEVLYGNSTVQVGEETVEGYFSMRQGDPLSSLDEVVAGSILQLGITVNGHEVNYLTDAGDLVIHSENVDRLKERSPALSTAMAAAGMVINSRKSIRITLRKEGKS